MVDSEGQISARFTFPAIGIIFGPIIVGLIIAKGIEGIAGFILSVAQGLMVGVKGIAGDFSKQIRYKLIQRFRQAVMSQAELLDG